MKKNYMEIPKTDMTLDKAIFFLANEPCITSLHQLVPEKKILKSTLTLIAIFDMQLVFYAS